MDADAIIGEMGEACIMMRVRTISRVVTGLYDEALRPFGLTSAQCSLLVVMGTLGAARRADIGRFTQQDRSTLTRNLQIMQGHGWIEDVGAGADGRGRPIGLSAAGRALLAEAGPAWRVAQAQAERLLGAEGVRVVMAVGDAAMGLRPVAAGVH